MSLRPIGPGYLRVLVRRDPDDTQSGVVIIPVVSRRHSQFGTVVRVMDNGLRTSRDFVRHSDVKPGDRVLFGKYSGTDIKVDGEVLTIMPESELLGVVEP